MNTNKGSLGRDACDTNRVENQGKVVGDNCVTGPLCERSQYRGDSCPPAVSWGATKVKVQRL